MFRRYENQQEVSIGDTVMLHREATGNVPAFATCIITDVRDGMAVLVRPHACAVGVGSRQAYVATEVFDVEVFSLVKHWAVFVTGPSMKKDNRFHQLT